MSSTLLSFPFLSTSLHGRFSFKLHATARQLHDYTRSEKMRLKEQATDEAEEQADPSFREKPSFTEAEATETFEGELDNFQTPLVRLSHLLFFYIGSHI